MMMLGRHAWGNGWRQIPGVEMPWLAATNYPKAHQRQFVATVHMCIRKRCIRMPEQRGATTMGGIIGKPLRQGARVVGYFGKSPWPEPTVSPAFMGQWLANKLDAQCVIANLSDDQRGLAEQVGIPLTKLLDEIVILSAFTIDFATLEMLGDSPYREEVRGGFIGGIQGWPAESVNKSMVVQIGLDEKGDRYHAAALKTLSQPPDRIGDPLADAFLDSIYTRPTLEQVQQSQDVAAQSGRAHMLALLTVKLDCWAYREFCKGIFIEFGLLPGSS
jgi:hypothetical protein